MDVEVQAGMRKWIRSQPESFYMNGMKKWIERLKKFVAVIGDLLKNEFRISGYNYRNTGLILLEFQKEQLHSPLKKTRLPSFFFIVSSYKNKQGRQFPRCERQTSV
ncbi:hypothetical protein TNCV_1461851 [Trichonephila clavipes]|nr:hypothetical protein TNCV_1461851 [Trichonephila clavipes]